MPALLILALLAQSAFAQYLLKRHPSASFGISTLAESPDGALWVGSNSGLYRFDGFRYTPVDGLPWPGVENIMRTRDGALWLSSTDHGLLHYTPATGFRLLSREPTFRLFPHEDQLFAETSNGWRSWSLSTLQSTLQSLPCNSGKHRPFPLKPALIVVPCPQGGQTRLVPAFGVARSPLPETIPPEILANRPSLLSRSGQLWFLGSDALHGFFPSLHIPLPLAGEHANTLTEDSRGHLWVGTNRGSLWEVSLTDRVHHWSTHFPIQQIFRDASRNLIAVAEQQLLRLHPDTRSWQPLGPPVERYDYVLPLPDGRFLAAIRASGLVYLSPQGQRLGPLDVPRALFQLAPRATHIHPENDFRRLLLTPGGDLFAGNKQGLILIRNNQPRLLTFGSQPSVHSVDLFTDPSGQLWVGAGPGVFRLSPDGTATPLPSSLPLFDVRTITQGQPGEFWVAHRQKNYFSHVSNGATQRFFASEGYPPAETNFIRADSRGWLWRGTPDGIYLSNGIHTAPPDWLHLTIAGEAAHYGFYEDDDHSLWLAGSRGITHITPDLAWFHAPPGPPSLSRLIVNGHPVSGQLPQAISLLRAELVSFPSFFRSQPLLYRLIPGPPNWLAATNSEVRIDSHAERYDSLEIRFAGTGAEILRLPLHAPRWPAYLPWLAVPLALSLWAAWRYHWFYWLRKIAFLARRWWAHKFTPAETPETDFTGALLHSRYRIVKPLSAGGFSQVYEAIDEHNANQPVAVKIGSQPVGQARWARSQYLQELASLRAVHHPGIISVLDSWIEPTGHPCLAMPLLHGRLLRSLLTGPPPSPSALATIITGLGEALSAVHHAGIIHRDLKPENIIVLDNHQPVLFDFGAGGLLGAEEAEGVTALLAGSLRYLAPERLSGHYSPASDLYSLGVICLELLSRHTLSDLPASPGSPRFVDELTLRLPAPFAGTAPLLAQALHFQPHLRPTDAALWTRQIVALFPDA